MFIKSLTNPRVKHLVRLRTSKRYRSEQGRLIITSSKIVSELTGPLYAALASEEKTLKGLSTSEALLSTPDIVKKAAGHPTDLVVEVPLPPPQDLSSCRRLLVLDRLTDPGNVGSLMRTALALGWDGLFCVQGSVDLFNDKVVRAARGAHFRLPYRVGPHEELLELLNRGNFHSLLADLHGDPPQKVEKERRLALILSSEAHGADPKLAAHAQRVSIPMSGPMESLNVAAAGAILLTCLTGA